MRLRVCGQTADRAFVNGRMEMPLKADKLRDTYIGGVLRRTLINSHTWECGLPVHKLWSTLIAVIS